MKCSNCKFTTPEYTYRGGVSTVHATCEIKLPPWVVVPDDVTRFVHIGEYGTSSCDLGVQKDESTDVVQ